MRPARPLGPAAAWGTVALVAAVLVLPSALGQGGLSPVVDISGDGEGSVAIDRPETFSFVVRNDSPALPGAEQQQAADVVVTATGAPEGWTVTVAPSSFELPPGGVQEVQVQVAVAPSASASTAEITVTADLYSPLEGLEPILGNLPGASQKASDSTVLSVRVENTFTRDVMEAIGPWIYALLLLLVAAVLVAVAITVAARRTLVRLTADARELAVAPGGKVAFPFRAEGLARDPDTVLLQVSAVQAGWAAFLPVPELDLEPGQAQDVSLVVIAPRDAPQGTKQAILVTATSAKAPKGAASLEFVAVVEGPEELPAVPRRPKSK